MKSKVHIREFHFTAKPPWELEHILLSPAWNEFWRTARKALEVLNGRVIWSVNSTAAGGGVAEMLHTFLPYMRGIGLDARWMVMKAEPPFFTVTKRLHNFLHGYPGDGGNLGGSEKEIYENTSFALGKQFKELAKPDDIIIFHDPQTAGMIPILKEMNVRVVWRCHIGRDDFNEYVNAGWQFLLPYLEQADAVIFTREKYIPKELKNKRVKIIMPSLDPFSPKNQEMDLATTRSILHSVGLIKHNNHPIAGHPCFFRNDGSRARINSQAKLVSSHGPPEAADSLITQISRWDHLKDPLGVIAGFQKALSKNPHLHLLLAGPDVEGVADDPEGAQVWQQVQSYWQDLDDTSRCHIHLACLPMSDLEENGAIVNAIQRQSSVIVQKSLQEGFGLTVTEAMWKGRPIVASQIGGIQDQLEHHKTGLLLADPKDTEQFSQLLLEILSDSIYAEYMGREAKKIVLQKFLFNRQFEDYFDLLHKII